MAHRYATFTKRMLGALTLLVASAGAHAGLIGATATCSISPFPLWQCNQGSATVVDPGTEFQLKLAGPNAYFGVDIGDNWLTLTLISSGGLQMGAGETLTIGGLTGANGTLGFSSVGETGFDFSDVTFDNGSLTMNLNGSNWSPGNQATIGLTLAEPSNVPEPQSTLLVGLALAGLGYSRRRAMKS